MYTTLGVDSMQGLNQIMYILKKIEHMIRALIVDDELHCRENLQLMVEDFCPDVKVVGTASNAASAIELIRGNEVDLVFLDIMMPGTDGFELLQSLDNPTFSIVFTTAHSEFALKAIKAGALDYLQKPIDIAELQSAVQKVVARIGATPKVKDVESTVRKVLNEIGLLDKPSGSSEVAIPTRDGLEVVKHRDIVRLEASDCYTTLYLEDGRKFLSSKTIKVYEDHLPPKYFLRVHKSHLLNLSFLKGFSRGEGNMAILKNGELIPVARRKLQLFLSRIQSF